MKMKLIIAVSALSLLAPTAALAAPKVCSSPQSFWLSWLPKSCNK
jgi:hypothetical protein